jgi:hypothetical protein
VDALAQPDTDAALAPGDRAGGRVLREHAVRRDPGVEAAHVVDFEVEAEARGKRGGFADAQIREVRDFHLTRFQRDAHRCGGEHDVGRRQGARQYENFSRGPHAGSQSHE